MKPILLLIPIFLISNPKEESFLTDIEYGKMLYNNPRGISCNKCHGKEGKGGHKIAKYYDKNSNIKVLKGSDITQYTLKELRDSLNDRYRSRVTKRRLRHRIMPKYYLTDEETKAIYRYLQSVE